MKIRSLVISLFAATITIFSATEGQAQPLKPDPKLTVGSLDNGLKYYIYPGTKPADQATYRLFIKSGSLYETDAQEGLAHFLEHMAFNGSDDFPKGSLISVLQAKGADFGGDINAHTGINETVYKLRLPVTSSASVDSALMVLENWAGKLTLDSAAVEKERGIIISEWYTRSGPEREVSMKFLEELLNGSRYVERSSIIGDTVILRNFKIEQLKDYYYNWYNPRLMAVAVAGDVDADFARQTIEKRFSGIPAPKVKTPAYKVPNYKTPEFKYVQNETVKTNEFSAIQLIDPFKPINNEKEYARYLERNIIASLFADRFATIARTDPGYKSASASISSVMNVKAALFGSVELKEGLVMEGIREFAGYYEQVFRYGFLSSEIYKVTKSYMESLKRRSDAGDTPSAGNMIDEMYSMFYNGNTIITPGEEYRLAQKYMGKIDSASIVRTLQKLRKPQQTHYFYVCNEEAGTVIPSEEEVLALFDSIASAPIKPFTKSITLHESLLDEEPTGGRIERTDTIPEINAVRYHLSNGARVLFKYSDDSKKRINMSGFRQGGISALDSTDCVTAQFAGGVISASGAGKFSAEELNMFMAGSSASSHFLIDRYRNGISAAASTDEAERMLALTYLKWTSPKVDPAVLELQKNRVFEKNKEQVRGNDIFGRELNLLVSGDSYMNRELTDSLVINELDPERLIPVFNQCFGSAEGFDFVLVGDMAAEDVAPLVEKYLGALPSSAGSAVDYKYKGPQIPQRDTTFIRDLGDDPHASVILYYQNDKPFTDVRRTNMVGDVATAVLRTKLIASLREEMNKVYGVSSAQSLTEKPSDLNRVLITFVCSPVDVDTLIARTVSDIRGMIASPESFETELADTKLSEIKKYKAESARYGFWLSGIRGVIYNGYPDWQYLTSYDKLLEGVTAEDVAAYLQQYIFDSHLVKAVLLPKPATASDEGAE